MQQLDLVRECGHLHLSSPYHLRCFITPFLVDEFSKKKMLHLASGFLINASSYGCYLRLLTGILSRYEIIYFRSV
jgi:hypothetical protein